MGLAFYLKVKFMILSAIIVNWNGNRLTKNCINSILETNPGKIKSGDFEITAIDNGSSDGSVEEPEKLTSITLLPVFIYQTFV